MLQTNKVFSALSAAEAATRFSRDEIVDKESVLLHTGWVASFCLLAAKEIEQNNIAFIDYGKLLQGAIVHDFDEIGTGDIPRITKYADPIALAKFREIEERSVRALEGFLGISNLFELWAKAKDDSVEGKIVRIADIAAVVYKVQMEIIHKNNYSFYRVSVELAEELAKAYGRLIYEEKNKEFVGWVYNLFIDMASVVAKANKICYDRDICNLNFSIEALHDTNKP